MSGNASRGSVIALTPSADRSLLGAVRSLGAGTGSTYPPGTTYKSWEQLPRRPNSDAFYLVKSIADHPGSAASPLRWHAEFLDQRLPSSRLVIIDAGHFAWEETPAQSASIILDSIRGHRGTKLPSLHRVAGS